MDKTAIDEIRRTLNVIESSGCTSSVSLLKSAQILLDEATRVALSEPTAILDPPAPSHKRPRVSIVHKNVCLTSIDDDFIYHARDQFEPGCSLERGLVKYAGANTICLNPLYGPDGNLIVPKNAVIEGFDWDPDTSRATFQIDTETAVVCKVELVISPMLMVHACI